MPAIDEFGGYSSRLRIPEIISINNGTTQLDQDTISIESKKNKKHSKKQAQRLTALRAGDDRFDSGDAKGQVSQNLC